MQHSPNLSNSPFLTYDPNSPELNHDNRPQLPLPGTAGYTTECTLAVNV